MPEEERENRVKLISGFYIVDNELIFANGWINIDVEKNDSPFYSWKTWTSISKKLFLEKQTALREGAIVAFEGKLETELPFYPNSKGLLTKTLIQVTNEAIIVDIKALGESKLKEDQLKPITEDRMIEIMQMLHHPPLA